MDVRNGVLSSPPGRGKKNKWRRRAFRVLGILIFILLLLYLLRIPLFAGTLKDYAARLISRAIHLPVTIQDLSGNWITKIEIRGIRSGPPAEGEVFRKLELQGILVSYAPWDLLLGRSTWLRRVEVRGLVLHLDLDQEKGKPSEPSPPPKPLPGFVWDLSPFLDLSIRNFDLHLEKKSFHLEKGRFRMETDGSCALTGERFSFPAPRGEEGPLDLHFSKVGPLLEHIQGTAARVTLSKTKVNFTRFPGTLSFKGNLSHPFGKLSFLGKIMKKRISFRLEGENLRSKGFADLLPPRVSTLFDRISTLSAQGAIDLDDPLNSDLACALTLKGREGKPLREGALQGTASQGDLHLSKFLLSGPWIQLEGKGNLSRRGPWNGEIRCRLEGKPEVRRFLPEAPNLDVEGGFHLALSGKGAKLRNGRLELSLRRLRVPGIPEIRKIEARADLAEGRLLKVHDLSATAGEGGIRGRGEIRFDTEGVHDWKGRIQGDDLDPWSLLGRRKRGKFSFLLWTRGGPDVAGVEGAVRLDPSPGSGLPSLQADTAWDFSWNQGILAVPRRNEGLLAGEPFQWTAKGAISRRKGTLYFPPMEFRGPGMEISARGTFPPLEGVDSLSIVGRITPSKITFQPAASYLRYLEIPGFSVGPGSPPLQVEAHASAQGGSLVFRGGEAGAPVMEFALEEAGAGAAPPPGAEAETPQEDVVDADYEVVDDDEKTE